MHQSPDASKLRVVASSTLGGGQLLVLLRSGRRAARAGSMSISLWLDKLGLGSYSSVFEEEELTEALLRSMAPDVLEAALDELGIVRTLGVEPEDDVTSAQLAAAQR